MRKCHALLAQWAVLCHHGVHGFRELEPVTDPRRATSLSIYEYHAQDPDPATTSLTFFAPWSVPGPMWPHNQIRRVRWVAVKYKVTWWVSKSDREMPHDRDWRRVGSLTKALAHIARKLHL